MLLHNKFYLIVLSVLFISCSAKDDATSSNKLELQASYNIDVLEPSGLAINGAGNVLYTVSDHTAKIYKLSTTGTIIQEFNYVGDDLEGISTYKDNKLLVVEERSKEIVEYNITTSATIKHVINYENNDSNSGLEGISYNTIDQTIFILNEKNPGKLIRLNSNFTVEEEFELNFASDYSGIFYENSSNSLWIVSDQNKTINNCTLSGELITRYSIGVTQAEGIAIANDKIYVVSDALEKLYVFTKPQP